MKTNIIISTVRINIFLFFNCQMDKKNKGQSNISYNVELTHPYKELRVEFVSDTIFTVEGGKAHIPYGGTNNFWGQSNAIFTEQYGVPKQVKLIFYALHEDIFYELDAILPVDRMKSLMDRAYAIRESESSDAEMKEFIKISDNRNFEKEFNMYSHSYHKVSDFVLGFSPKGKVTMWLRFSRIQKFIGEYQATPIKDDEQVAKEFYSRMAVGREEVRKLYFIDKEIPDIWSDYLYSSKWGMKPIVADGRVRVLELNLKYFNMESETLLRPWLLNDKIRERGVPKVVTVTWEVSKDEKYYANLFYDWEEVLSTFKEGKELGENIFKISIEEDNRTIKTYLGNLEVPYDSIRVFRSEEEYRDSY